MEVSTPKPFYGNSLNHLAIIMDGNGRWAEGKKLPRISGHKKGVEKVKEIVQIALEQNIKYLTLFVFSSENWRRPREEISFLFELLLQQLQKEIVALDKQQIKINFCGDFTPLDTKLKTLLEDAQIKTKDNERLILSLCVNYGGRWDIVQAVNSILIKEHNLKPKNGVTEEFFAQHLSLGDLPEPDLMIRTGGEQRLSNFLIWQLAYSELFFTSVLWPDFNRQIFNEAVEWFASRTRKFGRTSQQLI